MFILREPAYSACCVLEFGPSVREVWWWKVHSSAEGTPENAGAPGASCQRVRTCVCDACGAHGASYTLRM